MSLEDEFHAACIRAIDECRALGYTPTAWASMIGQSGGAVAAARRLLASGDMQSGFERLIRIGREDLTVERAVCDERWRELFARPYVEAAEWRLARARHDAELRATS